MCKVFSTKPSTEHALKNILAPLIPAPLSFQKGFEVTLIKNSGKKIGEIRKKRK